MRRFQVGDTEKRDRRMPMSVDAEHLGGPLNISQCRTTSIGHLREHVCAQQLQTWTTNTSIGSY